MILQVNVNLDGASLSKETLQRVHQLLLMEISSLPTESAATKPKASTVYPKETPQQLDSSNEAEMETLEEAKQTITTKTENLNVQNRPQPSLPDIQKAMMELANAKGNKEAKKLLEKYGATKVTALQEEVYANILEDVKQVMGNA